MDRRSFLKTSALGGTAAAATTLAAPLYAQGKRTLTMVTAWPRGFAVLDDAATYLNNMVNEMSDGSLTIEKKAPGELVGAFEVFDAVSSGQADMYHAADYYFIGQHPGLAYFTAVPFGGTAQELTNWYLHGGGHDLHNQIGEIFNMKMFLAGNSGSQSGGWFRKEINSLEDLQGLKMRIPGFAGEVFAEVGVNPTNIPPGELYTALERNTIDAVEWVGPSLDLRLGFQQIADYYYTGWHEPATELQFLVNKKVWEKLPADLREIMRVAMRTASYDMLVHSQHANAEAWANIKEEYPNVQIKKFPEEIFQAMHEANEKLLEEAAANNEQAAKIVESQQEYLEKSRAYTDISERAYLNTMAEVE